MKKKIWILLSIILVIGVIALAGCTTADRRPDTTPNQNRTTVPRQTRVTPPTTPTPGTTRTTPNNTRVAPRTTSPRTISDNPGTTDIPGTTSPRRVRRTETIDNDTARSQAKRIADAIAKERNIDSASCVITGDTALIGVQFEKQYKGELTDVIKKSVEKRVKDIEPDIDNVVVTADPDLLSRIKTIASDIENGKPLSGFTKEIEEIIRRINPF